MFCLLRAVALALFATSAVAMAQTPSQMFTFQIPAATSFSFKDSAGNTLTLAVPVATTLTLKSASSVAFAPLASDAEDLSYIESMPMGSAADDFSDVASFLILDNGWYWYPSNIGMYLGINNSCEKSTWDGAQP